MTAKDDDSTDRDRSKLLDAVPGPGFEVPGTGVLDELAAELRAGIEGLTPSADDIEAALEDVSLPEIGDLDVDATVRAGESVSEDEADAAVEAGGQTVDIAVENGADAATVLIDTGGEVVEVVVENGGDAAEATAELLAAALDGL